jgi:manganese-dependent inorganic pyrophosphatase
MGSPPDFAYVVGHKRPDTDAVVSAVMAARLLGRTRGDREYRPLMQGPAGPQTAWLFARAGLDLPPIRDDVRPTAAESAAAAETVGPETSLGAAADLLLHRGFSLLPVVDAGGRWLGAVGPAFPESRVLFHFNAEDFLGQLLDVPDLPRGLALEPLNPAAATPVAGARGSFVIHQPGVESGPGDVVLAGSSAALFGATGRPPAAVILANGSTPPAGAVAPLPFPVWRYPGSLMALVSEVGRAVPVGRIMTTSLPAVKPDDILEDLRPVFLRTPHALPVLGADGRLLGVVSRREALAPPRPGLVLVDHFERGQSVRGVEACDILEVIDHHRVGGLETVEPARIDCRPVGSTATILALRFEEHGLAPEPAEALLLLGALVADTLLLTSPTATATDRRVADALAARAGVDLGAFGREVLARNDGLAGEAAEVLVHRDLKEFSRGETRFLLGQIETVDLGLLTDARRAELLGALEAARRQAGAAFALTMVTDVIGGASRLLGVDPERGRLAHLLDGEDGAAGPLRAGFVSRKKQLVPLVLRRLAEWCA